jgi:hypothetical protein
MSNEFWQTIGNFVAAEMRGAEQERERILKLLETEKFSLPAGLKGGTTYIPIEELIPLIKESRSECRTRQFSMGD